MKQFEKVRVTKPKSSVFDLSHERKLTGDMGVLMPVFMTEIIPGDRFKVDFEALVRFQPLLAPIMHRINVYVHWFFVPNRLVWKDFPDFITGGRLGTSNPNFPKFTGTNAQFRAALGKHSLADYFKLPIGQYPDNANPAQPISQLPFRAYHLIHSEYYRDPTLEAPASEPEIYSSLDYTVNSQQATTWLSTKYRAWEKDYFTSALPNAQRGAAVTLPVSGVLPVTGNPTMMDQYGDPLLDYTGAATDATEGKLEMTKLGSTERAFFDGLTADLEGNISSTISDFRTALAIQRFLERNARAGYRYVEQILHRFGVKSSDARLQRPEYLGGGIMPVSIAEVLQMSQTDTTPQGNMAGHAVTGGTHVGFKRFFEEHGILMGIMSIIPRTAYQQGIPKLFTKFDKFDFYNPEFAHIGEQPVHFKELFYSGVTQDDDDVWGYQPRYTEYRQEFDSVHGDLRDTLNFWHLGRIFAQRPSLNSDFTKCIPDTRIYPVVGGHAMNYGRLVIQAYIRCKAIRPIPYFGDPV